MLEPKNSLFDYLLFQVQGYIKGTARSLTGQRGLDKVAWTAPHEGFLNPDGIGHC